MEVDDGGDGRTPPPPPPEGWKKAPDSGSDKPTKRKMKSPFQLEVLEKAYAVETYPSEAVRIELSAKIGLTDRQLQMWFCHRRLKDRKFNPPKRQKKDLDEDEDEPLQPPPAQLTVNEMMVAPTATGPNSSHFGVESRKAVARMRITGDTAGKRYYESPAMTLPPPPPPQLSQVDRRVMESVEAQLGEPLRHDGPILGVQFDPLPPGAFGAPIDMTLQQKQPVRPYDAKLFERHETKSIKASTFLPSMEHSFMPSSSSGKRKHSGAGSLVVHPHAGSRAPHEYQFLPQKPNIRSEAYERPLKSHFYDTPVVGANIRVTPLPSAHVLHGNEQIHLSRQQMYPSGSTEYDGAANTNPFTNTANDPQFGIHQVVGSENPYSSSDRIYNDEDSFRLERKRKLDQTEEARITKEVEAHEKKIRKELEKQDILRRKREEQMRKEMERHDRERRKEEERILREKQREEERFQREQRREIERREKFVQKESRRAEKLRQKEEVRREKETARLKAANERATARRIARESMELIEDERLELLELAASSKGVSSMISLDSDTLQQLDLFRDMLSTFPPKSVGLKKPFAIQPWADSEENTGNLLMVWKFLITFADVLGLWPFTLDEFVQSLHDYDSRLLGEIHVALLRSIIKDIEDVARTPAISQGLNQNSAANPGGGHPQIVEGAYAWGFDICSWQRHLNPLTWSEILRQFALSAGLGPQLKKRNVEHAYFRDDNEGNDGEEVISNLRNGAAAENAVALMQEKGYSHRRRSRHRLTPGTVKFAAFHILSLEGSKGLTILEVADKIQKSGLRDLTTSKTPEASIAAALSRDTKLFERTAPSTYCVRPAYRKNPADADTILSAAREKIQIFQSALSDSEEAEKDVEDVDDVEKDDDSECDVADDPEVDDLATSTDLTQDVPCSDELKDIRVSTSLIDKVEPAPQNGSRNGNEGFSVLPSENPKKISVAVNFREPSNINMEDTEIDESNYGEPWVQGLSEGEYSDLSVEERLNALVSLIGVAIEGNSIRAILEERLEAATALKKQMWAEAQLDKRRWKEDYTGKPQYSSLMGYKAEATQTNNATAEGSPTALHITDIKVNDVNSHPINNDQSLDPLSHGNINDNMAQELSGSVNPDMVPAQQYGYAAEKPRSQLKSFIGHKAEELYVYRSLPLGQDRRRNRYWQFSTSASRNDAGSGRIFFESRDGFWRLIDSEEAFDALLAALDTRGIRESHLHSMLQRIETTFKETNRRQKKISNSNPNEDLIKTGVAEMSPSPDHGTEFDSPNSMICGLTPDTSHSSSFKIELGRNKIERNAALERYNGFLKWMWKGCYNPFILCAMKYGKSRCSELLRTCNFCYQCFFGEEKHCPSCHKTFKSFHNADANFQEHVLQCEEKRKKTDPDGKIPLSDSLDPVGIQLLKAQLSVMEASIPAEAFQSFWTEGYRKSWGVKLQASSSAEDLMQILTLLEGAIKRDFLSSNYETTNQLLSSSTCSGVVGKFAAASGSVPVLPWVPDTTQAVTLRLLDLDASISYVKVDSQKDKEAGEFIKFPPRYTFVKNVQEYEPTGTPDHVDYQNERKWLDPGSSGRRGRGRGSRGGRVGRGRGRGRGSRGGHGSSIGAESRDGNYVIYEKTTRKYTKRGRGRGRGRKRGRRSIRPRQISESIEPVEKAAPHFSGFGNVGNPGSYIESSPRSSGDEWHIEESHGPLMEDDEHSAGFQSDENGQLQDYAGAYGAIQAGSAMDDESEDDDEAADGDGDGDGDDEDVEADVVDEYDEMGDEDGVVGGIGENGEDEDEGASSSFSSEYSD